MINPLPMHDAPNHRSNAFAPGDIYFIEYPDNTCFIRITGDDVEQQKTLRFDLDSQSVSIEDRSQRV